MFFPVESCLNLGPRWWQGKFWPCHHLGPNLFTNVGVTKLEHGSLILSPRLLFGRLNKITAHALILSP
jgi:hypothetical protein